MEYEPSKVKQKWRSREEIKEHLDAFKRSGLTQQAFCRERGLSVATFSNWRRKAEAAGKESEALFRPVRLNIPQDSCGPVVRLADGTELFFPQCACARDIASVVFALREVGSC
ncbi:MAG: hypothetical protein EA353_10115 [Puniceicoccaceae bacterium]|nr:MAG: hypothetical protein EA353_10115 [Puniceicoccaceae bacterium]